MTQETGTERDRTGQNHAAEDHPAQEHSAQDPATEGHVDDGHAALLDELGRLIRAGRPGEAVALADTALQESLPDHTATLVHLKRLGALLNLDDIERCPAAVDALHTLLGRFDDPAMVGEFHALAAGVAQRLGALERSVNHLVRGARALERAPDGFATAMAWLDLAVTYSYIGFHSDAVEALARAQRVAGAAGLDAATFSHPEIRVRYALWLDQQGDTSGCVRELLRINATLGQHDAQPQEIPYLVYSAARLAALGVRPRQPADAFSYEATSPEDVAVMLAARACLAIAAGDPRRALVHLAEVDRDGHVSEPEVRRLQALAYARDGQLAAALACERSVHRALRDRTARLHGLYVEGVAARLDQDELRQSVTRYSDEAHTDMLTGLPNRRHLERFVADLTRRGTYGTVGVADLDGFKAVNTVHGHLSGDEVLRQVAAILSRLLRRGDFLARYGGDEFVVVLPDTRLGAAAEVTGRLVAAVAGFDWSSVVPGTPVSLTMGLAELGPRTDLATAFRAADLVMLQEKKDR
ncbi:GGDEF domain-containing protein [Longispora sp. NPDC051575]|uniref:GGDEF domain-containing protein n=1 Tax=Longispora sp. NPDC051575 TaxID=3154943 RepID=UPI00344312B9